MHVAGTSRKLVHKIRMLVNFYVLAETVWSNSAHDAKLKIELTYIHTYFMRPKKAFQNKDRNYVQFN